MDERTRAVLERAAAAAERRKKELEQSSGTKSVVEEKAGNKEGIAGEGGGDGPTVGTTSPTKEEEKKEEGKKEGKTEEEQQSKKGKWSVGDVILASWFEDGLFYRARVEQVNDAGTLQESYTVTFIEYGNIQPNTPVAATAPCPPNVVTAPIATTAPPTPPHPTPAAAVEDKKPKEEEAVDEELLRLERMPSSSKASTTTTPSSPPPGAKLIGTNADGTPMYMTAEDDAKLKALKKADKKEKSEQRKEKVKGVFGKLKKKKNEDVDNNNNNDEPKANIVASSAWKKVEVDAVTSKSDVSPPPPAAPTVVSPGRDNPAHPKLSPRRPPPAPPVAGTGSSVDSLPFMDDAPSPRRPPPAPPVAPDPLEQLEPLPPIVAPTSLLDFTQVGHLFVALCDLRKLHCDAWVVPTGLDFVPAHYWFIKPITSTMARNYAGTGGVGLKYFGKDARVRRAPGWPDDRPVPYMVAIERRDDSSTLDWLLNPVKQFLELATLELKNTKPARGRLKHLIALPLVGTGGGGLPDRKGDVIQALLPVLLAHARDRNVDVVLTTNEPPIWSAIQSARAKLADQFAIPGKLLAKADELARYSRAGKLALFVGAGVSIGAGLPSWGGLLGDLMDKVGISADERQLMNDLSLLDQANILQRRMGAQAFSQAVADRLRSPSYSISHSLLASLNADSVVSTNYDTLFEDASRDAGKPCAVLPYSPSRDTNRFVLKMHGDVNHASDIVLTREDYLRYNNMKSALAGIVQSLLITKHFLFVGFSLTDDNFLKIVDQVRQAMGDQQQSKKKKIIGSATFLFDNSLFAELWSDIDIIAMTSSGKDFARAGNVLEIFLDFLSFRSLSSSTFLMEPHFDALLSAEDRAFKASLNAWMESFPKEARQSQSFTLLKSILRREFGGLKIAE